MYLVEMQCETYYSKMSLVLGKECSSYGMIFAELQIPVLTSKKAESIIYRYSQ